MRRTRRRQCHLSLVLTLVVSLVCGIDGAGARARASAPDPPATDVDVLFVERTPRIAFDPNDLQYRSGLPAPGAAVVYRAHVKNWGPNAVTVAYRWRFDGKPAGTGSVRIRPGTETTVPFRWHWQAAGHTLEFTADPGSRLPERSELNNTVAIRTNAMLLGLWVERSMYDWFHQHQIEFHDGANGFEDYLQRMVRRWNELFGRARFPSSPQGVLDRVALDEVVVVPDGALPLAGGLAGNNPDVRDRTVDMQWGIPWSPAAVSQPDGEYRFGWQTPFFLSPPLMHEMSHARFLPDLYSFDQAEPDAAHPQRILLTDDQGQAVAGTALMPFINFDHVYYNKWRDLMGAGPFFYDAHSAGVWNWKAHRRGRGNENAPPDFGVYFNDLPERNHVRFVDQAGRPITGAQVELYQQHGQVFDNQPDLVATTDGLGYVHLPRDPFGAVNATDGTVILKLRYRGQLYFMFQELTDFNVAFWRGQRNDAYYVREIDLRDVPIPVPDDAWLANSFAGDRFDRYLTSRTEPAIDFDWGTGAPAPGVPADDFSVFFQGGVRFSEGWKRFSITSDGGFRLSIDGRVVFDQWDNQGLKTWTPVIYTSADSPFVVPGHSEANGPTGSPAHHRVEIRYRHHSGQARVKMTWADLDPPAPIPVNAWRGDYFTTPDLHGYVTSRTETVIDNDYRNGSADPAQFFPDHWSARWVGNWDFPAGQRRFSVTADGGIQVLIDGRTVLDQWANHPLTTYHFSRDVSRGRHRIEVRYTDPGGTAAVRVAWT
jgi:hypothetical protein